MKSNDILFGALLAICCVFTMTTLEAYDRISVLNKKTQKVMDYQTMLDSISNSYSKSVFEEHRISEEYLKVIDSQTIMIKDLQKTLNEVY